MLYVNCTIRNNKKKKTKTHLMKRGPPIVIGGGGGGPLEIGPFLTNKILFEILKVHIEST